MAIALPEPYTHPNPPADWRTYRGFDGVERPCPAIDCHKCGAAYPGFFAIRIGSPDCADAARAQGWESATDIEARIRRELIAKGVDPDACACGECADCEP